MGAAFLRQAPRPRRRDAPLTVDMLLVMDFKVIGVHRVECSATDFDETLEIMWGTGLTGHELVRARSRTREHFDGLRLIVIEVIPAEAEIDWSCVAQPLPGVARRNWQVPYEEELIDSVPGRWAFFVHFVDSGRPLLTPVGERVLPSITPTPEYLVKKKYYPPG